MFSEFRVPCATVFECNATALCLTVEVATVLIIKTKSSYLV